ncbi:hypothetical protein HDK64DRAFT_67629 [Phyllosticta capitalensis]
MAVQAGFGAGSSTLFSFTVRCLQAPDGTSGQKKATSFRAKFPDTIRSTSSRPSPSALWLPELERQIPSIHSQHTSSPTQASHTARFETPRLFPAAHRRSNPRRRNADLQVEVLDLQVRCIPSVQSRPSFPQHMPAVPSEMPPPILSIFALYSRPSVPRQLLPRPHHLICHASTSLLRP